MKGAKGKGKATQKGRGEWKCDLAGPLLNGVKPSWGETKNRFVWEMLSVYYFGPAGRSINPETAFATLNKFTKEDLHRSVSVFLYRDCDHRLMNSLMWQQPLAAQAAKAIADRKECRVYEQYLAHILKELRRSEGRETQNEVLMYTQGKQSLTAVQSWY